MRRALIGAVLFALAVCSCLLFEPLSGLSGGADAADAGPEAEMGFDALSPMVDARVVTDATSIVDGGSPAFVQAQAGASADASTVAAAFDADVGNGDTIIVAVGYSASSASLVSINDTQKDAFATIFENIGGSGRHYYLAAAVGVKAGPDSVSVQLDGRVRGLELYVHEYANVSAFGVAAGASGPTTPAVDGMQSPLVTATVANELLFGFGTTGTGKSGTGFTTRSSFHDNVTEDWLLPSPGGYRATATVVAGTDWTMIAATFKPR